ncbi:MAG TPA: cytochrome c [Geminicoccus sp.]|uniref:c-type cytochrome n=1 Tax=Geminicoccus sp. TaxID=2024832 RepID=UPI002E359BB0|nr:cytochrome c [Geminicoccus sp.]HEX2528876.1 cytochrome c [Geminicoccus sp.]
MTALRLFLALLLVLVVGCIGFVAYGWRSEIDPVARPGQPDPALVQRGAQLAAIGNCNVCHTAPGGEPFAGGLALPTPFGTIYSTNITPDRETGIGTWSAEAFIRSMREGVDREGNHLYPAFPYDHFTLVTDEDNRALHAYLMTREPVRYVPPPNELPFPLDNRLLVAGWKLLFFDEADHQPDSGQDEAWNRGRYLAEGLGHCGACHTPRNRLGAEQEDRHFDGAEIEGWHAYAIDQTSAAPIPWNVDSLADYLRRGWHAEHGVARGPMAPVTANLGSVDPADVRAIATYVAATMGDPGPERLARAEQVRDAASGTGRLAQSADSLAVPATAASDDVGAAVYASACAICHESGRPLPFGGLDLHLSTAVNGPNPQNIINVTLFGLPASEGEAAPVMPGFAGTLSQQQLVALMNHLRGSFSEQPAWTDVEERVARTLSGEQPVSIYTSDGMQHAPATGMRTKPWP